MNRRPPWLVSLLTLCLVIGLAVALALVLRGGGEADPQAQPGAGSTASPQRPGTSDEPGDSETADDAAGHGHPGIEDCDVDDLPATTLDTIADIDAGGPYEFSRNDGGVFRNDEGLLPQEDRGYYHEYTVVTPGSDDRGARRVITGGEDPDQADQPEHWFFTDDHYDSFCEFVS